MALIEIYHVVADMYPIADSQTIREGMCVHLNADGEVEAADATDTDIIGIAGDNTTSSDADDLATPYSSNLTIGSGGSTQWTQNRVSDAFDETLASGKMTVYMGGGKFATDQYEADGTFAVGTTLYCDANGQLTDNDGGGNIVGVCVGTPTAYPSGVPGTDTTDGSLSLGDFLTFVLNIVPAA